jgi:hypothetical protein
MTVPSKIQRMAAAIYPITALVLIVPIVWLAFKHRKEKQIQLSKNQTRVFHP